MNGKYRHPHQNEPASSAYSLVEILIALGLFAVAITSLLSLFPVALRSEKESREETRATLIASGIMEALIPDKRGSVLLLASGMSNGLPVWKSISPEKATDVSIAYDVSCEPLRQISAEETPFPLADPDATDVATLRLISNSSLPGLLTAEVAVASPAAAPAAARTIRRFVRLITAP